MPAAGQRGRQRGSASQGDDHSDSESEEKGKNVSYKNKIAEYKAQMVTLNENNFLEWKEALLNLQYYAEWNEDVIDMKQSQPPWDKGEEADNKERRDRRHAYAIIRMTVSDKLKHLIKGVTPGDARGIYKRIYDRFCRITAGALKALQTEFATHTMASTGETVEVYSTTLQEKFGVLIEAQKKNWGPVEESELCTSFINGLLAPEFTAIKVYLSMQSVSTMKYDNVVKSVINYAMDNKLLSLQRSANSKRAAFNMNAKKKGHNGNSHQQICHNFKNGRPCYAEKSGNKCQYKHIKESDLPPCYEYRNKGTCPNGHRCRFSHRDDVKKSNGPGKSSYNKNDQGQPSKHDDSKYDKAANPKVIMLKRQARALKGVDDKTILSMQTAHDEGSSEQRANLVILDGAATDPICPWLDMFIPESIVDVDVEIGLGENGRCITATKEGTIRITPANESMSEIHQTKTLYAPDCPYLIIAERVYDEKGYAISKVNSKFVISEPFYAINQDNNDKINISATANANSVDVILHGELSKTDKLYHVNCIIDDMTTIMSNEHAHKQQRARTAYAMTKKELYEEHIADGHRDFNATLKDHGLPATGKESHPTCTGCEKWKPRTAAKTSKKKTVTTVTKHQKIASVLDIVEIDIGVMSYPTWKKEFYFQVAVDVKSRKGFISLMQLKSQSFHAFKYLYQYWSAQKPHLKLKCLRGGGEYNTKEFKEHAEQNGYVLDITSAYSEKAWIAERFIGLLRNICGPQLETAGMPMSDWGFSMEHGLHLINSHSTWYLRSTSCR